MEATPEVLELVAASKAILYMLSVLVALYFLGLFKGRWFFLFLLFPCFSFGYDVVLFKKSGVVYESYVTHGGETLAGIVCDVFSLTPDQQNILIKCKNKLTSNDTHLSMTSYSRIYNSEQNIFSSAGFGSVYCCPNCSGYPGTLSTTIVSVNEDSIPKAIFESASQGEQTGFYGEKVTTQITYDENGNPVGYTQSQFPPEGVTPIWDEMQNITGYVEGYFDDLGNWHYKPGMQNIPTEKLSALYDGFVSWFADWQEQEVEFKLTRDEFLLYIQAALARGASIEAAISALASASSSDIASLISVVQTGDGAIVSAINAIAPGGAGGEPSTVEVDLTPVVDALGDVKASVDSLQEIGDLPQPSVEDLALDPLSTPEDVVALQDYYTDWAVSLPGLLGESANFSLGFLFGSLPAIGSQTSLTLPTLNLPFCPPVTPSFSFPPDLDLSLIRDAFLFLLLIGFAFSAYRIVSSGMNI